MNEAELCAEKAGAFWYAEAYKAFVMFAKTRKTFTTGDVRVWLQSEKKIFPHDSRAWGAIARQAKKEKNVTATGQFVYSGSHGRPDAVWKSEIVK